MGMRKLNMGILVLVFVTGFGCMLGASGMADDRHDSRGFFERKDRNSVRFLERNDEGNETAGQIAAWLLLAANLPVALSILIKWTNRLAPLGAPLKNSLANFNRFQKKHLMAVHYYLNPAVFAVALWHYMSSHCRSTALPEWGLLLMTGFMTFGILIRFRWYPKAFRKSVYLIHTQPVLFVAMILILTVGHLIVD